MIRSVCPACRTKLNVPSRYAGTSIQCPKCSASIQVDGPLARDYDPLDFAEPPQQLPPIQQNVIVHTDYRFRREFPHTVHAVTTICTCGLWAPIWLLFYVLWPYHHFRD